MTVLLILFILVAIVYISMGLTIVGKSEEIVIVRKEVFKRVLRPGLNFILPFLDEQKGLSWKDAKAPQDWPFFVEMEKTNRINKRENTHEISLQNFITKDSISVDILINLSFLIYNPIKVVYEVYDLPYSLKNVIKTTLKQKIDKLNYEEVLESKEKLGKSVITILEEPLKKWGVTITKIELKDISVAPKPVMKMTQSLFQRKKTE